MNMYLSIAIGGALGACARYGMGTMALRLLGPGYPYGTLAVNVLGSLVMGVLIELMALRWSPSPELRVFLVTGFLGAFTTFSTFSLDAANLFQKGAYVEAGGYILVSVVLSIGGLFAGLQLMRVILS
ncbi:fluoride efflux transporter CrcB [Sneathiella chinensis]|uniref:Fluoride-specific ion channel FluC n=1 Tax=Sneathiella chinensis TaxID=349750 RepID=A0ABQ5U765_9PROT|nr:fluoride efflux transporter CrcB [Sneathiella chinensis]GLQ07754.1 putative fluoride ion transporter CrcB [Sneathiella chinensis]